jgi:hypothetical protein
VLTNLVVGQTLKFVKDKTKFSISKDDEVTINLRDGSVIIGKVVKLTDHDITIKTPEKEKKIVLISDMVSTEKCKYIIYTIRKKYWKRCKSENLSDFKFSLIK